jgi:GTP-binding protein HflX
LERALVVFVNPEEEDDEYTQNELFGLCEAAHVEPVGYIRQRLDRPNTSTYIGKGKVQEVLMAATDVRATLIIFDCELSGIQMRNLTDGIKMPIIDRTQLILDIFAHRARTKEGLLQVELAQYSYLMPRLMSLYTKFERQKGGIGMRGPGETKLESDRRVVKQKVARLTEEIEDIKKHREQQRKARRKYPFPFAALVGYTSVGKSTLMNKLGKTELLADAMPFATLDPTTRRIDLPQGYSFFLTDTVGFIRNLPTNLIAAFRATLEEVTQADFIIHLIDVSSGYWQEQCDAVLDTLENLKALGKPCITVFNKIDALHPTVNLEELLRDWPNSIAISALNSTGFEQLDAILIEMVQSHLRRVTLILPYDKAVLLEDCYQYGRVLKSEYKEEGIYIEAELVLEMFNRVEKYTI